MGGKGSGVRYSRLDDENREIPNMVVTTINLTDRLMDVLNWLKIATGKNRSKLVREALHAYLEYDPKILDEDYSSEKTVNSVHILYDDWVKLDNARLYKSEIMRLALRWYFKEALGYKEILNELPSIPQDELVLISELFEPETFGYDRIHFDKKNGYITHDNLGTFKISYNKNMEVLK